MLWCLTPLSCLSEQPCWLPCCVCFLSAVVWCFWCFVCSRDILPWIRFTGLLLWQGETYLITSVSSRSLQVYEIPENQRSQMATVQGKNCHPASSKRPLKRIQPSVFVSHAFCATSTGTKTCAARIDRDKENRGFQSRWHRPQDGTNPMGLLFQLLGVCALLYFQSMDYPPCVQAPPHVFGFSSHP